jgi:sugar-specific transcriptional regulator TrmB
MEIKEALQIIGLNGKESAVYMALLQIGRSSAYGIAEKSGLKKPTTYVVLDELIKKGMVQKVPRVRKQHYVAQSPEAAFALAEEKLALAKQKLPELLAISKGEETKVSTLYFEGVRGIKQLMTYRNKALKGQETVGFYATDKNADPELQKFFREEWNEENLRLGITMRGIVPSDPAIADFRATDTKYRREMKVVPSGQYSSEVAIDTIGDLVRIQDYKNLQGIIIENKDVAKTVREIFEMTWAKY